MRLLLIDDEPFEHRAMARALAQCGASADLTCVSEMSAALAEIEAGAFDLIFLDDRLTGAREYTQNAATLRAAGYGGEIVFFSNMAPSGDIGRALVKSDLSAEALTALLRPRPQGLVRQHRAEG